MKRSIQGVILFTALGVAIGVSVLARHADAKEEAHLKQLLNDFDRQKVAAVQTTSVDCSGVTSLAVDPSPEIGRFGMKSAHVVLGVVLKGNEYDYALVQNGDAVELRRNFNPYYPGQPGSILASQHLPGSKFCEDQRHTK